MSRIGRSPIALPDGVDVVVKDQTVTVKGPKGSLTRTFTDRVSVKVEDRVVVLDRINDERDSRAQHGLFRSLINNMVLGVSTGYRRELQAVGVGYRANLQGSRLELQVGMSHPVLIEKPEGIDFEVPEPTRIVVSGIDKELVGQTAANIRRVRPPEPYKGKGIRYVGEVVRRKAGKSGAK